MLRTRAPQRPSGKLHDRRAPCRAAILVAAGLLSVCLGGCGGGGGSARIESLALWPADFGARTGDVVDLYAFATYVGGGGGDVTREVTWRSDSPGVGAVSNAGRFNALAAGQTRITAEKGGVLSPATVITVAPRPALTTTDHFPLAAGNQWEYTGSQVSPAGAKPAQSNPITATITVTRKTVVDGAVWHELQVRGTDPAEPPVHRYRRHDEQGLMEIHAAAAGGGYVVSRLLDGSLTPGATWPDPEDPDRTFTIESVTEFIQVPAGDFHDCVMVVEVDSHEPDLETISWYKAGMGMVKWQVYDRTRHEAVRELRLVRAHFDVL